MPPLDRFVLAQVIHLNLPKKCMLHFHLQKRLILIHFSYLFFYIIMLLGIEFASAWVLGKGICMCTRSCYISTKEEEPQHWKILISIISIIKHGIWRGNRTINDYVQVVENLASIDCLVDDLNLVFIILNSLGPQYKYLDTSMSIWGVMQDFDKLVSLCIIEEIKLKLNA